ncbi:MAG: amino acid ABC transporter permease, partial [Cyanobacteria bacterium J06598_4]
MTIGKIEPGQAPLTQISPSKWLKQNLFSSWYNYILTIVSLGIVYWVGSKLFTWAFYAADWTVLQANFRLFFVGRYPVKSLWRAWITLGVIVALGGISWGVFAHQAAKLFTRRILIILGLLAVTCGLVAIPGGVQSSAILLGMLLLLIAGAFLGKKLSGQAPNFLSWLPVLWILAFGFNIWLLLGGNSVNLDRVSGLMLTIPVAIISILLCFPFGVLLALGRQSDLPVIR